jgi:hypothetical protein
MLPTISPVAPAVPQSPLAAVDIFGDPLQAAGQGATIKPQRIRNAFGSAVRTLIVAALLGGAVFGGRFGYDWYRDREAAPASVLPLEPVAPIDARFVTYAFDIDTPERMKFFVSTDLATGDSLTTIDNGTSLTRLARTQGAEWISSAGGAWVSNGSIQDGALDDDQLFTITDLFPVDMHSYVTVISDESVAIFGTPYVGPKVIDVGEVTVPASETDDNISDNISDNVIDNVGDSSDEISASGNVDPGLSEVLANPAPTASTAPTAPTAPTASTAPTAPPTPPTLPPRPSDGPQVPVRHVMFSIDRDAFTAADPIRAVESGFAGVGAVQIEVWVDEIGVVRRFVFPAAMNGIGGTLELVSASASGPGPLAGIDLENVAPAPVEVE